MYHEIVDPAFVITDKSIKFMKSTIISHSFLNSPNFWKVFKHFYYNCSITIMFRFAYSPVIKNLEETYTY